MYSHTDLLTFVTNAALVEKLSFMLLKRTLERTDSRDCMRHYIQGTIGNGHLCNSMTAAAIAVFY